MRKKDYQKRIAKATALLLTFACAVGNPGLNAKAYLDDDRVVVVSMGDSYSAGEGLSDFYGYDEYKKTKVYNEDWLAHRSKKSWPSRLEIPGVKKSLGNYHVDLDKTSTKDCQWYFIAVSGAETCHLNDEQPKPEDKPVMYLRPQKDIYKQISDPVDFVTMTFGGNDVGFAKIIECAVKCSVPFVGNDELVGMMNDLWAEIDVHKKNIKQTYVDVSKLAGDSATIIVAGYPKLIDPTGCLLINKKNAKIINDNVTDFNKVLAQLVKECQEDGIDIEFVNVEPTFDGHEAYTKDNWINRIYVFPKSDDIEKKLVSAYSVHPNDKGAQAYADCVNAKIKEVVERVGREYRIVLSWGENPSDLDSHVEGTLSNGSRFDACFRNKVIEDGGSKICELAVDEMMRRGPEEMTLYASLDKPYYYYVHRYRGAGSLQSSDAKVEIYQGDKLVETIKIKNDGTGGDYWNVFAIVDGKLQIQNTITSEADVTYANK